MRIPILAYQPMHVDGNEYAANELRSLAADLRIVTEQGFRIVPLRQVVDLWLDNRGHELTGKLVAITCDNGADFDYRDLPHPTAGVQRSVFNILRDFDAAHPKAQPDLNVTSFVIVSQEARAVLDRTCMVGKGWWNDDWWREAIASGLIHIGNHSWDHNHETLPDAFSMGTARGNFKLVASEPLADREIRRAAAYLRDAAPNPGTALFAYPYGQSNEYLVHDYFPRYGAEMGIRAAFTDRAGFLEPGVGRWEIPRFYCARDWSSPDELRAILDAAGGDGRIRTRPRAAIAAPAPREKPSRLTAELQFTAREKSGLISLRFDLDTPDALAGSAYRLVLQAESIGCRQELPVALTEGSASIPIVIHSHLLPNGTTRFSATLVQDGAGEVWSDKFSCSVSNSGPLAEQVRANLRENGAPLVREGLVDSGWFDIDNPALAPWFERPDALDHLASLRRSGAVDAREEPALRQFVTQGYAILPVRIEGALLDKVARELDDVVETKFDGYVAGSSQRVHNVHRSYPGMREIWTHPDVTRYLTHIFGVPPRACQTLTYIFGSQQGAHQDTIHLTPFPAGYMCGVWVALEDVRPESGELEVYAGSHRLPSVYMKGSGCAKVTDNDWSEFGDTIAARWREMLAVGGFEKVTYRPERGSILIWHANLMHAGGVRIDKALSRRSVVSHYFADGAIAFYDSTGLVGHME
jgi:hypothetical protein